MDNKDINSKTSPNQMRILMKRIREGKYTPNAYQETTKNELSMRDMLKITRKLNEDVEEKEPEVNLATAIDEQYLTQSFTNLFKDMNVNINLLSLSTDPKLKFTKNSAFWGGTIDGAIQFAYTITPEQNSAEAGIEFNYLPEFSVDDPDNQDIVKKIEIFYDTFYKYWKNEIPKRQ